VKTIAHLSDLHVGRDDPAVAAGLLSELDALRPDVVAVSGDLTQRARTRQFRAARAFLDRLPRPLLTVPGNHDIPLFDVVRRFAAPLKRYRRWIGEPCPCLVVDDLAVLGINTARSNTWKDGRVSFEQIDLIRTELGPLPARVFKVVMAHHPFLPPPDDPSPPLVGRSTEALHAADDAGVDLLLAGHLHVGYAGEVRARHVSARRSMLVSQAGTAISNRHRGEPNAYNVLRVETRRVEFELRVWNGREFEARSRRTWTREGDEWLGPGEPTAASPAPPGAPAPAPAPAPGAPPGSARTPGRG
jgi:3',5'-cyclic AMP phosphodiesterase CpdA